MEIHQIKYFALASILLGIVCKKNFNNLYIYQNRQMNLKSISNNYFIGSDRIRKFREKINNNLELIHDNKMVMDNVSLFLNDYSKEELLILRKNIKTLKINNSMVNKYLFSGTYNLETNTISSCESAFNHEMHHAASTLGFVDDVMVSGFMQDKEIDGKSIGIGMGLNEGYTEYLSIKQVGSDNIYYEKIVNLIPLIELFFDDPTELRKCYFSADLESFINRFLLVCSKEETISLLIDIDRLLFYDCFRTWFDKTDVIEYSIRLRLLDYYEKLSGNRNCRELFIPEYMVDSLDKVKKLVI